MKCLTGSKSFFPLSDQLHASQWATREVGSWQLSKQEPRGLEGSLLPRPCVRREGRAGIGHILGLRRAILTGCGVQQEETALMNRLDRAQGWPPGRRWGHTRQSQAKCHPWEFGVEADMGPIRGAKEVYGMDEHLVFDKSPRLDLCILVSRVFHFWSPL